MQYETYETLVKQIADVLMRRANADLRELHLTMPQANALRALANQPEHKVTFKEMEKLTHMAQSTTASLIARLEQKKLAVSFGDERDKRIKTVALTDEGHRRFLLAEAKREATEEQLLSGLTEVERVLFLALLKKIASYLQ